MNKKIIITALFALVAMAGQAQEKLMRIGEDVSSQKKNAQYLFYNKEKARLLMPKDTAFGVECISSFSPEWSLTYDSVAHALVYNEAQKSIWYSTYGAMYKKKTITKNGRKIAMRKLRKHPKDYVAPDVKTYSLPINVEQAQMLKAICSDAIGTSEPREDSMLDGTTWIYFIVEQRAKARTEDNFIVKLTDKLVEAVKAGDVSRCDSLIGAEFQHVVANLEIVPKSKE